MRPCAFPFLFFFLFFWACCRARIHVTNVFECLPVAAGPFRLNNIVREVTTFAPDVVCFQEVQEGRPQVELFARMEAQGYDGRFVKRTGDKVCTWRVAALFERGFHPVVFHSTTAVR